MHLVISLHSIYYYILYNLKRSCEFGAELAMFVVKEVRTIWCSVHVAGSNEFKQRAKIL